MNLPEQKSSMEVLENEEGDIENILDEEAEKIREKEKKEKQELIAQLQDYKIKVLWKNIFSIQTSKKNQTLKFLNLNISISF